jgi:hypothetical protein
MGGSDIIDQAPMARQTVRDLTAVPAPQPTFGNVAGAEIQD